MTALQPAYGRRIAILIVCVFFVGPALFVGYRAVQTLRVLTLVERERDEWQRPEVILQSLNVKEGSVVVDLGCGAGYFALKLSPIVGTHGTVLAEDKYNRRPPAPMESLTLYLIAISALLILSVVVSKGAGRFGIPGLSIFLLIGIIVGREGPGGFPFSNYLHKRSLTVFHDGLAWLMQIAMFLTMGLLVLPSELSRVAVSGIILSGFLVLVARPVSVLLCLTPFRFSVREQLMVSWAGLRGAVPIVVATYPLIAGASDAKTIFNLVFFVVFISVLLQGATIPMMSKWLRVAAPIVKKFQYPIEYNPTTNLRSELVEVPVPSQSAVIGRSLVDLKLPAGALIILIRRGDDVLVPRGSTQIQSADTLLVLAEPEILRGIRAIVNQIGAA